MACIEIRTLGSPLARSPVVHYKQQGAITAMEHVQTFVDGITAVECARCKHLVVGRLLNNILRAAYPKVIQHIKERVRKNRKKPKSP